VKHILVVDDDPHLRDVVVYTLQREGHAVTAAADGRAALTALLAPSPSPSTWWCSTS
jgi:two-component system OmpR family response regulator